jgi:hypothetical protein
MRCISPNEYGSQPREEFSFPPTFAGLIALGSPRCLLGNLLGCAAVTRLESGRSLFGERDRRESSETDFAVVDHSTRVFRWVAKENPQGTVPEHSGDAERFS